MCALRATIERAPHEDAPTKKIAVQRGLKARKLLAQGKVCAAHRSPGLRGNGVARGLMHRSGMTPRL